MRLQTILRILVAILLACLPISVAAPAGAAPTDRLSQADRDRVAAEILANVNRGADPAAAATAAAKQKVFGLIALGQMGDLRPTGITCFTPHGRAPVVLAAFGHGDSIGPEVMRLAAYAQAYNRAIVSHADYPDADLCRPTEAADRTAPRNLFPVNVAARRIVTPPRSLPEAARRGDAADIRRLIGKNGVNAIDGVGMTPLAWAVARNNGKVIEPLLKAGANPWVDQGDEQNAIFFAALFGRRALFEHLVVLPGRDRVAQWSPSYLNAAVKGGDATIIAHMLAEPHGRLLMDMLESPRPSASSLEPVLKNTPALANDLLRNTASHSADRADLVALAIRYGADPNGKANFGKTVLGAVANGLEPAAVEIVDILLKAGADPNRLSDRQRPIWIAVGTLHLGIKNGSESSAHATAIFTKLIAAGADINLPDDQGIPPIRGLLFPYRWNRDTLDASFVTPALLEMLVHKGLDLNAEWRGRRVLALVEEQAGAQSELATTLRRLGAR